MSKHHKGLCDLIEKAMQDRRQEVWVSPRDFGRSADIRWFEGLCVQHGYTFEEGSYVDLVRGRSYTGETKHIMRLRDST